MGGKMYLSFQRTNLQTHRAKPLPKKEATAVIVKFSVHGLFQRFLFSTFLIRNPIYSGPTMPLK